MRTLVRSAVILLMAFACDENPRDEIDLAVSRARIFCDASASELGWLQALIIESRKDAQKRGDVLAVRVNNEPLFVHQPLVMSCLGCLVYTCSGMRVEIDQTDREALILAMDDGEVIYRP